MTPRCEHPGCVHACRVAETVRPPCDDPELVALVDGERCECCGLADCDGVSCWDDSPSAADVREGEERAQAYYHRMHGVTL